MTCGRYCAWMWASPQAQCGYHRHSRTQCSGPESGYRAGYDGVKRKKGSKVHAAVDTFSKLLALLVTPACEQDRAQAGRHAQVVQQATETS